MDSTIAPHNDPVGISNFAILSISGFGSASAAGTAVHNSSRNPGGLPRRKCLKRADQCANLGTGALFRSLVPWVTDSNILLPAR